MNKVNIYWNKLKSANVSKKAMVAACAITAVGVTTAIAAGGAGTGGSAFNPILTEVEGWLTGAPGKIIATLAFGAAMFNVVKQNFIAAIGAFLGAMLMANANSVIDTFMSAGL